MLKNEIWHQNHRQVELNFGPKLKHVFENEHAITKQKKI